MSPTAAVVIALLAGLSVALGALLIATNHFLRKSWAREQELCRAIDQLLEAATTVREASPPRTPSI